MIRPGFFCVWIVVIGFFTGATVDLFTVGYFGFVCTVVVLELVFLAGAGDDSFIPVIWSPFIKDYNIINKYADPIIIKIKLILQFIRILKLLKVLIYLKNSILKIKINVDNTNLW